MPAIDQIHPVRKRLQRELGREPTLTEVSEKIGVSRERVRQLYVRLGLDTGAGRRAMYAPSKHARAVALAESEARRRKRERRDAAIVCLAKEEPHLTQGQIARRMGVSQRQVSELMIRAGLARRHMFTPEEDEVVMNIGLRVTEVARLLNRASSVITMRRRALVAGRDPYTEDPDLAESVVASFKQHRVARAVADDLGVPYEAVLRIVKRHFGKRRIAECVAELA